MPPFNDVSPYIVVLVELEEGGRVTANLVECTPKVAHVGMPVEIIYEQATDEITLPLFRPVNQY